MFLLLTLAVLGLQAGITPQNVVFLFLRLRDLLICTSHGPRTQQPLVCLLCSICYMDSRPPQLEGADKIVSSHAMQAFPGRDHSSV